jgi:hypothetical protein
MSKRSAAIPTETPHEMSRVNRRRRDEGTRGVVERLVTSYQRSEISPPEEGSKGAKPWQM